MHIDDGIEPGATGLLADISPVGLGIARPTSTATKHAGEARRVLFGSLQHARKEVTAMVDASATPAALALLAFLVAVLVTAALTR